MFYKEISEHTKKFVEEHRDNTRELVVSTLLSITKNVSDLDAAILESLLKGDLVDINDISKSEVANILLDLYMSTDLLEYILGLNLHPEDYKSEVVS